MFGQTGYSLAREGKDGGKEGRREFHNFGLLDQRFFSESGHQNWNLRNGILTSMTLEFTPESQTLEIDLGSPTEKLLQGSKYIISLRYLE